MTFAGVFLQHNANTPLATIMPKPIASGTIALLKDANLKKYATNEQQDKNSSDIKDTKLIFLIYNFLYQKQISSGENH